MIIKIKSLISPKIKIMKIHYLKMVVLATLFITPRLFAQEVKIENGTQFKVTSLESVESVLEVTKAKTTFLTQAGLTGKKFRLLSLNENLNSKSSIEIDLPEIDKKKVKYVASGKYGESVYIFSRYYDRKENKISLFASEINTSTGKFNRDFEVISAVDDKFSSFSNPFTLTRSIDSTKLLVVIQYPVRNNENVRYGLKVLNNDMSAVWSKDINFNEQNRDFTLNDIEVDRKGNIHMIANMRMSREEKKEKDVDSRYYVNVYSYFHNSDELEQYEIGFQNDIIRTIDLDVNEKDELIGMGFYSEKKFTLNDSYTGFFFLKINPNSRKVVTSTQSKFSTELIEELVGERKAKKGKFPTYLTRKSIPLSNGGYAVVLEHYNYTYSTQTSPNGAQTTFETWLFGNVVVMYLDENGEMKTASVIKKRQYCTAKNGAPSYLQMLGVGTYPGVNELPYYGISVLENDDNIYLLYNENPKNEARLKEGKNPKSVRQRTSVTMLVTSTPDGKVNGNVLFKSKDRSEGIMMPLMPRSYVQYSENAAIVFGRKGKTMRATRITFS